MSTSYHVETTSLNGKGSPHQKLRLSLSPIHGASAAGAVHSLSPLRASLVHPASPPLSSPSVDQCSIIPRPPEVEDETSIDEQLQYALAIVNAKSLSSSQAEELMNLTLKTWTDHVNPGFLQYRKSVAEDHAAIEFSDDPSNPGGSTLLSADGKKYIDCLGGYGIFNVGRSHPKVVRAVQAQLMKQPLHSQELLDPLRALLASVISSTLHNKLPYGFFVNSGAEAVESAMKFAILATGHCHFVAVKGGFSGKTLGALSLTSKKVFREPFKHALQQVTHVNINDVKGLETVFEVAAFTGNHIAGVLVEPVLGEGGIHVLSNEFMKTVETLCRKHKAMFISDEVQCGMGRTGKFYGFEHSQVVPDLVCLGKALGGGVMPVAAVFGTAQCWEKYLDNPFLFTTTFGGNPLACAAALATIDVIRSDNLMDNARERGDQFMKTLSRYKDSYPSLIKDVRGRGLMIGIEFTMNEVGYLFAKKCFNEGVLIAGTLINATTIRIEPPLTITESEVNAVLGVMKRGLDEMLSISSLSSSNSATSCAGSLHKGLSC